MLLQRAGGSRHAVALGQSDFGSAKGCWLFPGNLCYELGMPKD